jgi:hypothetical protein
MHGNMPPPPSSVTWSDDGSRSVNGAKRPSAQHEAYGYFCLPERPFLLPAISTGHVKGSGYRLVADLSAGAEGRCPKASKEGTRGGVAGGLPSMGI